MKKYFFLVLLLVLCTVAGLQAQVAAMGDVNGDSSINIVDALQTAQYAVGLLPISFFNTLQADVNGSGKIDIVDALMIAQYYVGLISVFPVPVPPAADYMKAFQDWARTQNIDLTKYKIILTANTFLNTILPGYGFISCIHIQYPVAYYPLDPILGETCIAAVNQNLAVEILGTADALRVFYRAHQLAPMTYANCPSAIKAWFSLSQELKNDGFYTFTIPDDQIKVIDITGLPRYQVSGLSQVVNGGSGAIKATLYFDASGLLESVTETVELVPGIRPVCQSTKLLDKDPVVRKMAEQDLLVMGTGAKEYLFAQRAKVSPDLQMAIDRIWQRILEREAQLQQIGKMLGR